MDSIRKFKEMNALFQKIIEKNQETYDNFSADLKKMLVSTQERTDASIKRWLDFKGSRYDNMDFNFKKIIANYRQMASILMNRRLTFEKNQDAIQRFLDNCSKFAENYTYSHIHDNTLNVKNIHGKLCQLMTAEMLIDLKHRSELKEQTFNVEVEDDCPDVYIKFAEHEDIIMPKLTKIIWPSDFLKQMLLGKSEEDTSIKILINELKSALLCILVNRSPNVPNIQSPKPSDLNVCVQIRTVSVKKTTARPSCESTESIANAATNSFPDRPQSAPPSLVHMDEPPIALTLQKNDSGWSVVKLDGVYIEEEEEATILLDFNILHKEDDINVTDFSLEEMNTIFADSHETLSHPFGFVGFEDIESSPQHSEPSTSGISSVLSVQKSAEPTVDKQNIKKLSVEDRKEASVNSLGESSTSPQLNIQESSKLRQRKRRERKSPKKCACCINKSPAKLPRNRPPENSEETDTEIYCICRQMSYGDMIACDGPNCRFEWYHYPCVGVVEAPVGKWYCPRCRKSREK